MKRILTGLVVIALAACSSEKADTSDSADDYAARIGNADRSGAASAGTAAAAGEGVYTADGQAPGSSLANGPPPAMPALAGTGEIPTEFRGVWDFIDGSCSASSDLRMEVRENRIGFYESEGRVAGLEAKGDDRVTVDLAMTGEGEEWTERLTLTLVDGGRFLETGDVGPYGDGQALRRKRCP